MEWENPLALAAGDTGIAAQGLLSAVASVVIVAEETAQEANVVCRDVVVVVESYGGESAHEDTELLLVGDLRCQNGIQSVIALDDDDVVGTYAEAVILVDSLSELEVIAGEEDFLTAQQLAEVLVEKLSVNGLYTLKVLVAAGVPGRVDAIYKVVVGRYRVGAQAAGHHEDGQSLGRCSLAAGGRAGDEYETAATLLYGVDDLVEFLLLQGFADIDQLGGIATLHSLVEVARGSAAEYVLPSLVLAYDLMHLGLRRERLELGRVLSGRYAQEQTIVVRHDLEEVYGSRVCEQAGIEIVYGVGELIVVRIERGLTLEQLDLAVHALGLKERYSLFDGALYVMYGEVGCNDLLHTLAYGLSVVGSDCPADAQLAVVAARDSRTYDEPTLGIEVFDRLGKDKKESACVGAHSAGTAYVEKFYVLRVVEAIAQALVFVVDSGTHRAVWDIEA